jgi:hypothetical protein
MARSIKILSDFDGVWTNQGPEAQELIAWATRELCALRRIDAEEGQADMTRFLEVMRRSPVEHGWAPTGRISAYVDEDPLVEMSALCRLLGNADDPVALRYRQAVLAEGFESLEVFAETMFSAATEAFRRDHPPSLIDDARDCLAALHEIGAEVVVISNSSAGKIADWFRGVGVDAGEDPGHALRVRGSAAKWFVGDHDETLEVSGRTVHTNRPKYRAAIEAEAADVIIGDVFSLDLALPHAMRRAAEPSAPHTLVLRRHDHTPRWVLDDLAGGAIDHVVDGVHALPEIVRTLRRA